jgi:hypothetical protein
LHPGNHYFVCFPTMQLKNSNYINKKVHHCCGIYRADISCNPRARGFLGKLCFSLSTHELKLNIKNIACKIQAPG